MDCDSIVGALYFSTFVSSLSFIFLGLMSRRLQKIEWCLAQCIEDEEDEHAD
jgi:hypothetical protein